MADRLTSVVSLQMGLQMGLHSLGRETSSPGERAPDMGKCGMPTSSLLGAEYCGAEEQGTPGKH